MLSSLLRENRTINVAVTVSIYKAIWDCRASHFHGLGFSKPPASSCICLGDSCSPGQEVPCEHSVSGLCLCFCRPGQASQGDPGLPSPEHLSESCVCSLDETGDPAVASSHCCPHEPPAAMPLLWPQGFLRLQGTWVPQGFWLGDPFVLLCFLPDLLPPCPSWPSTSDPASPSSLLFILNFLRPFLTNQNESSGGPKGLT